MSVKYKHMVTSTLGWRRTRRNMQRFGWVLYNVNGEEIVTTETYYEGTQEGDKFIIEGKIENGELRLPTTTRERRKYRMHLWFYRDSSWYKNLAAVIPLEIFFYIFYYLRKILGPIIFPAFFLTAMSMGVFQLSDDVVMKCSIVIGAIFWAWLISLILEGVLSRIAKAILKVKR